MTGALMICIAISRLFPICGHPLSLQEQHNDNLEYLWLLKLSTLCLDNVHVRLHCNSILADHNSHIDQRILVFFHIFANNIVVAKSWAEMLWLHPIPLEQRTGTLLQDEQPGQHWSYWSCNHFHFHRDDNRTLVSHCLDCNKSICLLHHIFSNSHLYVPQLKYDLK